MMSCRLSKLETRGAGEKTAKQVVALIDLFQIGKMNHATRTGLPSRILDLSAFSLVSLCLNFLLQGPSKSFASVFARSSNDAAGEDDTNSFSDDRQPLSISYDAYTHGCRTDTEATTLGRLINLTVAHQRSGPAYLRSYNCSSATQVGIRA